MYVFLRVRTIRNNMCSSKERKMNKQTKARLWVCVFSALFFLLFQFKADYWKENWVAHQSRVVCLYVVYKSFLGIDNCKIGSSSWCNMACKLVGFSASPSLFFPLSLSICYPMLSHHTTSRTDSSLPASGLIGAHQRDSSNRTESSISASKSRTRVVMICWLMLSSLSSSSVALSTPRWECCDRPLNMSSKLRAQP